MRCGTSRAVDDCRNLILPLALRVLIAIVKSRGLTLRYELLGEILESTSNSYVIDLPISTH